MSTHIEFSTAARLPSTGSKTVYGTAELRSDYTGASGSNLIALGTIESASLKDTGTDEELAGEDGATETFLMMDEGKELSLGVRFTKGVPAPRKGWFIGVLTPESVLTPVTESLPTVVTNQSERFYLITSVTLEWGNKAVRKYNLTCRIWNSIPAAAGMSAVARVTTATGAIASGNYHPAPLQA